MQLKTLYLPLLAFIFTLSLVDLPPVAALYFPAHLTTTLTGSIVALLQQHVSPENPTFRAEEEDLDPEDFWKRVRELGDAARRYGGKLMEDAAERSKDVREKLGELKERMEAIVHGATALHDELQASVKWQARRSMHSDEADEINASADGLAEDLERAFENVLEELKVMFPAPNEAPSHEERQKVVVAALEKAGAALITVCVKHGMDEERVRLHWGTVRSAIENMVVLVGDLVEQHPDLLSAVLFTVAVMLIPEYWLLRPLLRVFGFWPLGPGKGTPASWAQRVFYGAAVNKGSWFAYLQEAAMSMNPPRWGWLRKLLGWLGW